MSNDVYPSFAGLKPEVDRNPEWNTTVKEAVNGQETCVALRAWPRWRYTLTYEVLRSQYSAFTERAQLMGFFNKHRAQFDDFLYLDEEDNAVAGQAFGVTDGVATLFQLARPIDTWIEPVWAPAAAPAIKRGDTLLVAGTDYTLGSTGQVQLASAGSSGQTLTWTGGYYMRVRFAKDTANFKRFMKGLWQTGSIELLSKVYA